MFIGHLPAGYLLTRAFARSPALSEVNRKALMAVGLIGSVFADVDLLYFYLVDHASTHHYQYVTHCPLFWLVVLAAAFSLRTGKRRVWLLLTGVFVANVMLHLALDTIVGDVWWLAPFVNQPFSLFTVQAIVKPWWLNFILHWTFLLELALLFAAVCVFCREQYRRDYGV